MRAETIYLVGFVAAGKSSLARELGRRLDWRVEDVDDRVEAREGMSVAAIFATKGEARFRAAEREIVRDLAGRPRTVVATGAGTFSDPELRALMKAAGAVFWIDVPFDLLVGRIPKDGSRPVAGSRVELERLYSSRCLAYAQAHVRLDGARASIADLADQVIDWLGT